MRILAAALCLLLGAQAAQAQTSVSIDTIDQSLFHSEPLEDEEAAGKPVLPTKRAAPGKAAPEKTEQPLEYNTALLQGLKKVSAETMTFEAPVDTPIQFGTLTITVKKCVKSKPEDQPENSALILIQDQKPDEQPATVFSGWMFSSSPAISALEHPVYDITMLECVAKKH